MHKKLNIEQSIRNRLSFIYKENYKPEHAEKLLKLVNDAKSKMKGLEAGHKWSEKDIILITYGDSIVKESEPSLTTLKRFLNQRLGTELSIVHILPFFPYSSDDGFSVIDFKQVNPHLGGWQEVNELGKDFKLMFDLVINHASQEHEWFKQFLENKLPGKDYFIAADPNLDLSDVVRPRSTPLLTPYKTKDGEKHVWTTFSADQVDLNFANPALLIEMMDVLLHYLLNGAHIIRLDAIAFLWKEIGTTCLHLPETHEVVKLIRDIMEEVNPASVVLTETNVPNKENLSYFGQGDEAHMVYQFSLPPLLLHALYSGNSQYLVQWASSLTNIPEGCTFFNFTASHDGIGVRPLEGLLPEGEKQALFEGMKKNGGFINTKRNKDGTDSPYELNITYFDALKANKDDENTLQVERFLASQIIMMSMRGIPAFYIHSFLSTPNYLEGVKETGHNRTINRKKYTEDEVNAHLAEGNRHDNILQQLKAALTKRKLQTAFHPDAGQEILGLGNSLFGFIRKSEKQDIMVLANVTAHEQAVDIPQAKRFYFDILGGYEFPSGKIVLKPYQVVWLTKK